MTTHDDLEGVDTDVAIVARQWGLDPHLLQAVVKAEGGGDAIIKAVRCSIPSVTTRAAALPILARSATHAMSDYIKANCPGAFVAFWAARWAPPNAENDPHNLNANWVKNVTELWT